MRRDYAGYEFATAVSGRRGAGDKRNAIRALRFAVGLCLIVDRCLTDFRIVRCARRTEKTSERGQNEGPINKGPTGQHLITVDANSEESVKARVTPSLSRGEPNLELAHR